MFVFLLKALGIFLIAAAITGAFIGPAWGEVLGRLREQRPRDDDRRPIAGGSGIGQIFGLLDRLVRGIQDAWYGFWRGLWYGPVQLLLLWILLGGSAVMTVLETVGREILPYV